MSRVLAPLRALALAMPLLALSPCTAHPQIIQRPTTMQKAMLPPPATPIRGYEIVAGPSLEFAPLQAGSVSARCPNGKVALSTAWEFVGAPDASYGFETEGALMLGLDANRMTGEARVRNANVFERGTARAYVVCAFAPAGVRRVDLALDGTQRELYVGCKAGERIVGGNGGTAPTFGHLGSNGPMGDGDATTWAISALTPTGGMTSRGMTGGSILCAPSSSADGWEVVQSSRADLGSRQRITLDLQCPAGKVLLTAGVWHGVGNINDFVMNRMAIQPNGSASVQVQNRNIAPGASSFSVIFRGICARAG